MNTFLRDTITSFLHLGAARGALITVGLLTAGSLLTPVEAQNAYVQHNLVSDLPGLADHTDTNLVNPWGISFSGSSPFWISDNHTGVSTLYANGTPQALVVTIPPPSGGTPPGAPTGTVFNSTTNFPVTGTNAAKFIFDTEDGTVAAWNAGASAVIKVDNSNAGTVYKGLAIAAVGTATYLYAADFHNNKIDVIDGAWAVQNWAGAFTDNTLPAGYAPFNIQKIGTNLYVTYAVQDAAAHDDVPGIGHGFVDVYDSSGNLLQRLIAQGALNSPWGLAMAPTNFGAFSGDLLVGNFGDGRINVFNPTNGQWIDSIRGLDGNPFVEIGLWGLAFGNGGSGGPANSLFFTAGIPGPDGVEDHGLYGSLSALFPKVTGGVSYHQHNLVSDLAGMADVTDTNLVNPWGISFSSASPFWIADNHAGVSTLYNTVGTPQALIVTIPPPSGGTPPAAPTGTVFNTTTNFKVGALASKFIFDTEDGTIVAWTNGGAANLEVDHSATGAVYKGLTLGSVGASNYLYATDFHNNKIEVVDGGWAHATLAGSFSDPTIPAGFAPFNIQNIGGKLYVTYAKQDAEAHDDISGPGNGYVNIFDTSGQFVRRLVSQGALNSPWGVALAPAGFGGFAGAVLIGNFGDGRINAYDPQSGAWLGFLYTDTGDPFTELGLWALAFGNGGNGGEPHTLYFTAGIPGPGAIEDHGLFGSLAPSIVSFATTVRTNSSLVLTWAGGTGPFEIQTKTNLSSPTWSDVIVTTNKTLTVTNNATNAFFRIIDQGQ